MKTIRCDAVIVQLVATEYDEQGRPVGEMALSPVKVFRANAGDFWALVDETVDRLKQQASATATPPADLGPKGKRR
jgi:hypothetical protein